MHVRAAAAPSALDRIAIAGLVAGAVGGIAGTMAGSAPLRQLLWGIDGVALVVASALLAIRYLRRGDDAVAAGFVVFAIGEGLLVSGTGAGLDASVPSFGGGVALWAAGLALISAPSTMPLWARAAGLLAAVLFTVVAVRILLGEPLLPTASPLPFFAYPVLVLSFAGWIAALLGGR
jgi:hypothetical protein